MKEIAPANALDPEHLPIEYIPRLLQPVAKMTGAAAIFRLMQAFGGLSIYVPETRGPDSRLLAVVGEKAFTIITYYFQGDRIYIPKFPTEKAMKAVRDQAIRSDRADGATVLSLAAKYGLSDRTIRKITNSPPSKQAVGAA